MKCKFVFCALVLLLSQIAATAAVLTVPSRTYPTIQSAINAAGNEDTIEVAPNPNPYYPVAYTGTGNRNLDFQGKQITLKSQINPSNPNWNIINSTIIDCGGVPGGMSTANRAFYFHSGEGSASRVIGFKIINGYARGPKGADGESGFIGDVWRDEPVMGVPWQTAPNFDNPPPDFEVDDPCTLPPIALSGNDAAGDGYGGAIFCENGSSPIIKYCVFEDNTVTGAHGGRGADGMSGPWFNYTWSDFNWAPGDTYQLLLEDAEPEENLNGQWGGTGGIGDGTGFGGAIACLSNSSPLINSCIFRNNSAQGGRGGDGGNGGNGAYFPDFDDGDEGAGGNAGDSVGDGIGGVVYVAGDCSPVITDCNFEGNSAKTGPRAEGGELGQGNTSDPPAPIGAPGEVHPGASVSIAGGAVYFEHGANAQFTNCRFVENSAYFAFDIDQGFGEDIAGYTAGGAVYFDGENSILIDTCSFIDNTGGALYCGPSSGLNINNDYAVSIGQPGRKNIFLRNTSPSWMGGAIYIDSGCSVDISNASFGENRAASDGGAIKSISSVSITNCVFSGNTAEGFGGGYIGYGYGGAIDVYSGSNLTINMSNCNFVGNESVWGGALSSEIFTASLLNCFFLDNKAKMGGALDLGLGTVNITSSVMRGNRATDGDGGAVNCRNTTAQIENCEFFDNSADSFYAWGGAINFYGGASPNSHIVKNCLFAGNSAGFEGGAISCALGVNPQILNSTFNENIADEFGGAIFIDWDSDAFIRDCIISNNNKHAIHEEDFSGNAIAEFCLFNNNPDGHYYDSSTGLVYDDPTLIPGGSDNIPGDPLFLTGLLGDYYLNQDNSPAIDNGSALASSIGLDTRTTATDDSNDTGQVDIGYHFRKAAEVPTYQLTTGVVGGHGTISPGGTYYAGAIVTVTAQPQTGWFVKQWTGTEDDSVKTATATVVMNSDRSVTVEFNAPRILYVGGDTGYPTIQAAIDDAQDMDIIQLMPSSQPYYTQWGYTIDGLNITITSVDPNDPCVVASTVIEQEVGPNAGVGRAFTFSNVGPLTRLQGITIRNFFVRGLDGLDGDPSQGYYDGRFGNSVAAIGIVLSNASPTIENCVIDNCHSTGGDGGDGAGGDQDHPDAGNGGWGGAVYGGAVTCANNSNPAFKNCTFSNNSATGGNGGDGGNGIEDPYGLGGRGGSWYYGYNPPSPWELGIPIDALPKDYSGGLGGAVLVDSNCAPTFENCTFVNNTSSSGLNGICGQDGPPAALRDEPSVRYRIDNVGGAVYIAEGGDAEFIDCTFTGNTADPSKLPASNDAFVGFGGAIAAESGDSVLFDNCQFVNNTSDVGGGIYSNVSYPEIYDSSFSENIAYHGGAVLMTGGTAVISGSVFTANEANQPGSEGGAIALLGADAEIIDCNFTANASTGSGGGIYVSSQGIDGIELPSGNSVLLDNCLIIGNLAIFNGAGVASVWNSGLDIVNCTIANNVAEQGIGGGLYAAYSSYTQIINSILWGNMAPGGAQIAVTNNNDPAYVKVTYSDVEGGAGFVRVDPGATLEWDVPAGDPAYPTNIHSDPLFVTGPMGEFYLSQIPAGQSQTSPCVDAGSDLAEALGFRLYTTRTDEAPDRAVVDMGYHTPILEPCRFVDLERDGTIDLLDLAWLVERWLYTDCGDANGWCEGADLSYDTIVNFDDYVILGSCWMERDSSPPTPNPSQWAIEPYAASSTSVSMRAIESLDELWGFPVQYSFECDSGDCHNSDWQSEPNYTDVNLAPDTEYSYKVKARDTVGNETDPSVIRFVTTTIGPGSDTTPPTPDPMTWAIAPRAATSTSIEMRATTATDNSGGTVQYEFDETSGNPGGTDSGWQNDPCYIDTGIDPNSEYCYRVRARDQYNNITGWSTEICVSNLGDPNPPTPAPTFIISPDVNYVGAETYDISGQFQFMVYPVDYRWWHKIVVNVAGITDDVTPADALEVRFICLSNSSFSSTNRVPVPITLGLGDGVLGSRVDLWRVTIAGDAIVYDVDVDTYAVTGRILNWMVCVYDAAGNSICTELHTLGPPNP
ncbi:MAG: right-handed parallel beta-helix repeat-containing protein [Planctomycetota bacterium]